MIVTRGRLSFAFVRSFEGWVPWHSDLAHGRSVKAYAAWRRAASWLQSASQLAKYVSSNGGSSCRSRPALMACIRSCATTRSSWSCDNRRGAGSASIRWLSRSLACQAWSRPNRRNASGGLKRQHAAKQPVTMFRSPGKEVSLAHSADETDRRIASTYRRLPIGPPPFLSTSRRARMRPERLKDSPSASPPS